MLLKKGKDYYFQLFSNVNIIELKLETLLINIYFRCKIQTNFPSQFKNNDTRMIISWFQRLFY